MCNAIPYIAGTPVHDAIWKQMLEGNHMDEYYRNGNSQLTCFLSRKQMTWLTALSPGLAISTLIPTLTPADSRAHN